LLSVAIDAELAAFKSLHALTNSLPIDLKDTLALITPDSPERVRTRHSEFLDKIKSEYDTLWSAQHTGAQLDKLRADNRLIPYLDHPDQDVVRFVQKDTWHEEYSYLLHRSNSQCENLQTFLGLVRRLRRLNTALNNYADRNLITGIDRLTSTMATLQAALSDNPLKTG
jgi:hypothetical protein